MARRRLNKKVALIGTAVFVLGAMLAVVVILRLTRDPAQFIADGDAAWAAKDYESARRNYAKAFESSDSLDQKVDLLFKLSDVYQATGDWLRVLGCWEQIITSDPKDLPARLARLKYAYVQASSLSDVGQSVGGYWNEVSSQATELIDLAESTGLLEKEKAQLEPSFGEAEQRGWDDGLALLGPYLYFIKGRAAFELASMGAVTSPEQLLEEAKGNLGKAKELDPKNAAVYRYLAAVFLETGEIAGSRGNRDEQEASVKAAEDILAEGVAAAGDVPSAHINVLVRKLTLAQGRPVAEAREKMKTLEPQYKELAERFPASAEARAAMAEFYSFYAAYVSLDVGRGLLDRAIEAAEKASALDKATVKYARFAASLYYRKSALGADEAALQKAIDLAEAALALPQAQDTPGPRHYAVLTERFSLCSLLAKSYVERVLALPQSAPERGGLLAKAEGVVHEIEQIQGSGENPQVVKWQGMLELARGHRDSAVRSLCAAYEQIKASSASDEGDPYLSYTLGKVFEGTPEVGAVIEFLGSALSSGIVNTRPDALLDYTTALLHAGSHDVALSAVNGFDERFGANLRSRQLRARILIASGHLAEAEEAVAQLDTADPNTLRLQLSLLGAKAGQLRDAIKRAESVVGLSDPIEGQPTTEDKEGNAQANVTAMKAELLGYLRRQAQIARQLWQTEAEVAEEDHLTVLCDTLIGQNEIVAAKSVVEVFLNDLPDNAVALFYKGLLSEPDPSACSQARRREIRMQAIDSMADPVARSVALGAFYRESDRLDEAVVEWRKVLDATASQETPPEPVFMHNRQLSSRQVAAAQLFDIARYREDWRLAEEIVQMAKAGNLDGCGGHLYAGRLAFARSRQKEALEELSECLRLRPVFSYGYMLRSSIQAAIGNERAAIDDARRASDLNPVDPIVAKALANALLVRNRDLGNSVSEEQKRETKLSLERAIRLNPGDTQVLVAYADLIDASEPMKALAIRQTIQIKTPSLNNAVMLGRLATRVALTETGETRKKALFTMAETAFEQARQADPSNAFVLESYAEYYRARGQNDKARELLVESQDERLLWRHYYRIGRYEEARRLLERMLNEQADNTDALKGLILVAQATADQAAVKTYGERLLSLEDNVTNRLAQIRAYLDAGLVQDAEYKLQGFKERYPDEPRIGLMEALLAKRRGQLKRALELANRHLEKNQQDASAWRLRGEISLLRGDADQAITDFGKSRSLEDNPVTTVALAKAYVWAGRDSEAIRELRAALEAPAVPPEARMVLESIYRRLGRNDSLRQLYADTLAQFPNSIAWLTRAGSFAIDERDYNRATELYEKALQLRQAELSGVSREMRDMPYAFALDGYLRALVLSAGEPDKPGGAWRPELLDKVFREGEQYVDTPYAAEVLHRMAEASKARGDMDAAKDYCRRAVDKAWGDDTVAAEVLLRVYLLLGPDEVSHYCRQRLETDPGSLVANFTMSNLARVRGDYDDAVNYIDKCIALSGSETQRRTEYMLKKADTLTVAYQKTSDKQYLEAAIDVYESLLAQMPTNNNVLNNLAYMLAQDDRELPRALEYAKKILANDPDNAVFLDTYAYVLHKNGRDAEAAGSVAAAIQQYEVKGTPSAEVYEHLGMIKEALGEKKNALAAYRRALEVADDTMSEAVKERIRLAVERLQ
ncbi:MAG: hypothetical protein JW955_19610 [Sedimentisphaerales bacterium]|nr:hypothetical protein [Sedimentisphaerales bacterium]